MSIPEQFSLSRTMINTQIDDSIKIKQKFLFIKRQTFLFNNVESKVSK